MDLHKFNALNPTIQITFLISMHIRNKMEDFHCKHLSDEQMKELYPIIRQEVYDGLNYLKIVSNVKEGNTEEQQLAQDAIHFLIQMIPDYWELP